MHAEDLLVDDRSNGKAVEAVRERLPELDVVPPLALVVESVDAVDRSALVVASEEEEVLWVLDLVGEEEADCLQALLAAVHVVSQEQVVGLRREASVLEEAQQVEVLTVDVSANLDGGLELQQDRLAHEHLPGAKAERADLLLGELYVARGLASTDLQEPRNHAIYINISCHGDLCSLSCSLCEVEQSNDCKRAPNDQFLGCVLVSTAHNVQ
mmetsp:Transcript_13966/g.55101  ORF Transcript_13966/g.55101 Transcript_13966/m.55101 type:complete len:212 (+) Transcript_13966:662-1297(+)